MSSLCLFLFIDEALILSFPAVQTLNDDHDVIRRILPHYPYIGILTDGG